MSLTLPNAQRDQESLVNALALPISQADKEHLIQTGQLPVGAKVALLAQTNSDETAIIFCNREGVEKSMTWADFDSASNQVARLFKSYGVTADGSVVVALANCIEHVVATFAAWKLGAMVVPLDPSCPTRQAAGVLAQLSADALVVTDSEEIKYAATQTPPTITQSPTVSQSPRKITVCSRADIRDCELSGEALEIATPQPGLAFCTGGSTGVPRLIVKPPRLCVPLQGVFEVVPLRERKYVGLGVIQADTQLIAGPLFHGGPFVPGLLVGLASGQKVILMERFDAEQAVSLIGRHSVNLVFLVPTMMRRILQIPAVEARDFSSIVTIYHGAAVCPQDVKRHWIDLVGAKHILELYGATDSTGCCIIRGDEWLEHPGSVGLPVGCELKIVGEDGRPCEPGEVGEIFMRQLGDGTEKPHDSADGFHSVGDLGYVDGDGYLFIADRRNDLIISGGANVYPAEVEAALARYPGVSDVAVVGLADDDLGKRVHAIVEPAAGSTITSADLAEFCRSELEREKQPRSFEFVERLPRNEAGKLQRSALVEERV